MKTKKQKVFQIGAIVFTVLAVICVFLMIFVNDRFTNLTILFGLMSTIFVNASNATPKKEELTKTDT
jgi:hypothetical protein